MTLTDPLATLEPLVYARNEASRLISDAFFSTFFVVVVIIIIIKERVLVVDGKENPFLPRPPTFPFYCCVLIITDTTTV